MLIGKLNIVCKVRYENKRPKTFIQVLMGQEVIASRETLGHWDNESARKELRRFPERFKLENGWTLEILKAVAA